MDALFEQLLNEARQSNPQSEAVDFFERLLDQSSYKAVSKIKTRSPSRDRVIFYKQKEEPIKVLDIIDALLKKKDNHVSNERTTLESLNQLMLDQLFLDRSKGFVSYQGHEVDLTPIQFKLLWLLVENYNEVLTRPFLCELVLEREFGPNDRSLDMHLSRVRKKLMDVGMPSNRLVTIHGKGYRFN